MHVFIKVADGRVYPVVNFNESFSILEGQPYLQIVPGNRKTLGNANCQGKVVKVVSTK